jgi:LysM repeat protein
MAAGRSLFVLACLMAVASSLAAREPRWRHRLPRRSPGEEALALNRRLCPLPSLAALCPYYITQRKDTLYDIATKNGINVEDLVSVLGECINWNEESVLQIGQKLCLPPWYSKCVYVEAAAGNMNCKFYTVHPGDTVSAIADDFGVLQEDIQAINKDVLNDTSPIREGMLLRLPYW